MIEFSGFKTWFDKWIVQYSLNLENDHTITRIFVSDPALRNLVCKENLSKFKLLKNKKTEHLQSCKSNNMRGLLKNFRIVTGDSVGLSDIDEKKE